MSQILQKFEERQKTKLSEGKTFDDFSYGDTVKVGIVVSEGNNKRVQIFEGLCIKKRNRGINSSFVIRKVSNGEGVEKTFPLYSPQIDSIKIVKRGVVRRAKLYYIRDLQGKAARIPEKKRVIKQS